MAKIVKAWVDTHKRANGRSFYTAHIRFRSMFLWFIPYYYTYNLVSMGEYMLLKPSDSLLDSYQFSIKKVAEDCLIEEVNRLYSDIAKRKNNKIIESTREYVNLFPINDPN